jgi:phospholipase C
MQENRSFDTYFGTYPGADGIPIVDGKPSVCLPQKPGPCVAPFHDSADVTLVNTATVQGNGFAWYHVPWHGVDGWTAKSNTS